MKVPFIARWPGKILPGVVTESMCSHYDVIQTFNELLDLKATLPENLPGKSFANVLLTGENTDNHIVIFDEYGNELAKAQVKYMKMDVRNIATNNDVHEEMCYLIKDDVKEINFLEK